MNNYDEYFNKNSVCQYKFKYPCKKSYFLTQLRKTGDIKNQYVQNIHYNDTLSYDYDKTEIYSSYNDMDEYSPVYSSYHSDCDICLEHKKKVKENLIVGYKIYPKGVYPSKTYKQRKQEWEQFK